MAGKKHLTGSERMQIENHLKEGASLKQIALKLGRSASTISREVKARALPSDKGAPYRVRNRCVSRGGCEKRYRCGDLKPNCTKLCRSCNTCNAVCDEFVEEVCWRLSESPYVCNGCLDERQCVLGKKYYINRKAHEAYREMLVESRAGANITEGELLSLDAFISPLIMKGQSVHHIVANNPDQFNVSEKTIYRYVDGSLLKARNIDMPRVCRIRPRRKKPMEHKVDSKCRIGRTLVDFHAFKSKTPVPAVEMDSVLGRIGGKVLLTLMFKSCDLMLAFIRGRNTSQSVIDIFDMLYELLGADCFKSLFKVCVGDNGSEFSNPRLLEHDAQGNRRTHVFYCDAYASYQKPNVELNHEFIRKVLPKGTSFDNLTQNDISLMMSHINSYSREKLQDKSPFDVFSFLYGNGILEKLGIKKIPPNDIVLRPSLLRKQVRAPLPEPKKG
jgi:IS30 family transposase